MGGRARAPNTLQTRLRLPSQGRGPRPSPNQTEILNLNTWQPPAIRRRHWHWEPGSRETYGDAGRLCGQCHQGSGRTVWAGRGATRTRTSRHDPPGQESTAQYGQATDKRQSLRAAGTSVRLSAIKPRRPRRAATSQTFSLGPRPPAAHGLRRGETSDSDTPARLACPWRIGSCHTSNAGHQRQRRPGQLR